jgi:alpha-methylacyl-CoA racemase
VTGMRYQDDPRTRGLQSLCLDLKHPDGARAALDLFASADVVLEGMRPGAMERLGLGPAEVHAVNPRVIYARSTGWGQDGPASRSVGHDINYLALSGTLSALGPSDRPPMPPLNLLADFGGGGTFLVMGVLAALVHRTSTELGQVIDAAMVDGVASLTAMIHGLLDSAGWSSSRESNLLDGGAPFYRCYERVTGATSP